MTEFLGYATCTQSRKTYITQLPHFRSGLAGHVQLTGFSSSAVKRDDGVPIVPEELCRLVINVPWNQPQVYPAKGKAHINPAQLQLSQDVIEARNQLLSVFDKYSLDPSETQDDATAFDQVMVGDGEMDSRNSRSSSPLAKPESTCQS